MNQNNFKCKLHNMKLRLQMNGINLTITNLLAFLCILIATIGFINPEFKFFYGINNIFYSQGDYFTVLIQFFSGTFLHGDFLHLIMNLVFLVYFGNIVEEMIGKTKYILFFLFIVFFEGFAILYLGNGNTIGISGFNLAVLTYYALKLYDIKHPEFQSAMTVIVINVLLGFSPGISFLGHFFGSLGGLIFYYLLNKEINFEDFYKK